MRRIAPLMGDISLQLRELMVNEIKSGTEGCKGRAAEVDLGEWLGRAALYVCCPSDDFVLV